MALCALAGAVIAVVLWRMLAPAPAPDIRYRTAFVPKEVLVAGEPDTVVKFVERIVWRTAPPEQVAVAPDAALPDVAAFCGAAGWVQQPAEPSAGLDSVPPGQTMGPPLPRVLLLRSFDYQDGELTLWGPRSDGDLWRGDYRVGRRFRGTVAGDSVFIQADRYGHWKTFGERALWMAGGAALGYAVSQF